MKKTIQAVVAAAAICASLAFSAMGVARAASGFVSGTLPGRVVTIYLQAPATGTAVATSTPAPPRLPGQEESNKIGSQGVHEAEPTEMDEEHSQGSVLEEDDSDDMFGTPQPGVTRHHESDSHGSSQNSGDDDGDGD